MRNFHASTAAGAAYLSAMFWGGVLGLVVGGVVGFFAGYLYGGAL